MVAEEIRKPAISISLLSVNNPSNADIGANERMSIPVSLKWISIKILLIIIVWRA